MRSLVILFLVTGCRDEVTDKDTFDSGPTSEDEDGDGYTDDCDDNNPNVFPGNAEVCDGLDNDCNGQIDDDPIDSSLWYADNDGDGWGDLDSATDACDAPEGHVDIFGDCDDTDVRYNPVAVEFDCEDPNDYNCDGSVGYDDSDGDGYAACSECNDADSAVHPDAPEVCNEIDDDCDTEIDEDDSDLTDGSTFYGDSDGDGHGGQQFEAIGCEAPPGYVDNTDDCNDLDPYTYPSAAEICDEEDNDCDGNIDEGVGLTWYADADGDGYGDASSSASFCDAPQGYTANGNDCDDTSPATNPSAYEICDGIDNNCDGNIDDSSALNTTTWYADTDNDGYGDATNSVDACSAPTGYVADATDCNDAAAETNPAADEICDSADNDCDGTIDGEDATDASTFYNDSDSDSYGDASTGQTACTAPSGTVADNTDCDDASTTTNPGATEVCNGTDDNCDGATDEGVLSTFYADFDSDGYGSPTVSQDACTAPAAYVSDNTDCNDVDGSINPGGTETCDTANNDEDCDGTADNDDPDGASGTTLFYPDVDSDGFGDQADSGTAYCDNPGDLTTDNTDCDDTTSGAAVNPGATETWYDGTDSDCDGASDYDADGDGIDSADHGGDDCDDSNSNSTAPCYLYTFTTHDFTSCGVTGRTGPSLIACSSAYSTTDNWDEDPSYLTMSTQGIQRWTVPATGSYQITATGAAGYSAGQSASASAGATIQGDFDLTQGDILQILVAQMGGGNSTHGNENGGGGGSFVVTADTNSPLIVAGGGGGAPSTTYSHSCTNTNGDGQLGTSGKTVSCSGCATGTGGSGGSGGSTSGGHNGAAGGGFLSDGQDSASPHCSPGVKGGKAFINGGEGGEYDSCYGPPAHGGFGGGGAGELGSPGGAGGYSGGGAAGCWSSYSDYGGGGGSFNGGTNQVASAGTGTSDGTVTITLLSLN